MNIQDHIAAIDAALDAFAEDSTIQLVDYAAAISDIAYRVNCSADAAQDDLFRTH